MLAATYVKMSGSEKPEWTGTQTFPPIKRVNRKLREVSRFIRAKQRQGNVQISVVHVPSWFWLNLAD